MMMIALTYAFILLTLVLSFDLGISHDERRERRIRCDDVVHHRYDDFVYIYLIIITHNNIIAHNRNDARRSAEYEHVCGARRRCDDKRRTAGLVRQGRLYALHSIC